MSEGPKRLRATALLKQHCNTTALGGSRIKRRIRVLVQRSHASVCASRQADRRRLQLKHARHSWATCRTSSRSRRFVPAQLRRPVKCARQANRPAVTLCAISFCLLLPLGGRAYSSCGDVAIHSQPPAPVTILRPPPSTSLTKLPSLVHELGAAPVELPKRCSVRVRSFQVRS